MKKPFRTTIVFGLLSSLMMFPVVWYAGIRYGWPILFELVLWANVAVYAGLMCGWSRVRFRNALFPLLLLLGVAFWPTRHDAFILIALGVFSWIRSGVCFKTAPVRSLAAELITVLGAAGFIGLWWPQSALAWSLAVWFFFLVQTSYFFIVPLTFDRVLEQKTSDSFEQASLELERILEHS